jgi:hypothetical protein
MTMLFVTSVTYITSVTHMTCVTHSPVLWVVSIQVHLHGLSCSCRRCRREYVNRMNLESMRSIWLVYLYYRINERQLYVRTTVLSSDLSSSPSHRSSSSSRPTLHRLVLHPFVDMEADSTGGARLGETTLYADIVTILTAARTKTHISSQHRSYYHCTNSVSFNLVFLLACTRFVEPATREGSPRA